jgi:hypothetical protein
MTKTKGIQRPDASWRFGIRLLVKHPQADLSHLTAMLALQPHISWKAGDDRVTRQGRKIPGVYQSSAWSHSIHVKGKCAFFEEADKLIAKLVPHKTVLLKVIKGGGNVCIIIALPGDVSMGDSFSWESMKNLSALRINLGIEVYRDFGSS